MDAGVQPSIIGILQARLYAKHTDVNLALSPNGQHYKFGYNGAKRPSTLFERIPVA